MRVIAIASQKGGVGKTTTTLALGSLLSRRGRKVLMVDMDPQSSLSISCGVKSNSNTLSDVLLGDISIGKTMWEVQEGLYLVPSDLRLSQVELVLVGKIGRENILKKSLAAVAQALELDYCLIDCPPSLSLLTINGLVAASEVIIPTKPEFLGRQSLDPLMEIIQEVKDTINPKLEILGILPTFCNERLKHHTQIIDEWKEANYPILDVRIGQTIKAAEAPLLSKSIVDYAPKARVSDGYRQLVDIIDR